METASSENKRNALSEILILTGLCLIGMLVFSLISVFALEKIFGLDAAGLMSSDDPGSAGETGRTALLIMQGLISLGSFILFPLLIRYFNPKPDSPAIKLSNSLLLLVAGLSLLMMPVNAWLAAWNQNVRLPSFLKGFQSWAWAREQEMEKLTSYLVEFSAWPQTLLGFLVIAILAGITEEFFFRKMLQPRIIRLTGNPHTGIWLTAFLFSAIHIQFYGLIPRMVLGGLFGYYFYWTGSLILPALGHILNNGITLLGLILYQQKISPVNVENPDEIPWYLGAIAAGVAWNLSGMVREEAIRIRKKSNRNEPIPHE